MKKIFFYALMAGMVAFASCEDDKDEKVLKLKTPAEFESIEQSDFTFNAENAASAFPEIKWKAADFGLQAAVTYTVKLANNDAKDTTVIGTTTGTSLKFTNAEMNALMAKVSGYPGQTYNYSILLEANAYDANKSEASNTLTFRAKSYDPKAVAWDYVYIAAGYPKWDYTTAYMLGDPNGAHAYEGYVYFAEDNTNFAITSGANASVVLAENQTAGAKGLYKVSIDSDNQVTIEGPIKWGIIGDATSNGWNGDTDMEFDPDTRMWTVVTTLLDKEFKFRGNANWNINLGATTGNEVAFNGSNIKVNTAHAYIVTLNITNAGKYTYSLEETDIEQSSASMLVLGSYITDGWNADNTNVYTLASPARDFKYTGTYLYPANTEFKFNDAGTWTGIPAGTQLTWANNKATFNFVLGSGDNIKLTDAGYYRMDVDTKKLTATITKTGWEIIGDATPGAWDNGTLMTYNADGTWSIDITLTAGSFKFRWDGAWDLNYGGSPSALVEGGDNIAATPGDYTIVLNPDAKTATVTKK